MEVVAYCRGPYCVYADDAVRLCALAGALLAGSMSLPLSGDAAGLLVAGAGLIERGEPPE